MKNSRSSSKKNLRKLLPKCRIAKHSEDNKIFAGSVCAPSVVLNSSDTSVSSQLQNYELQHVRNSDDTEKLKAKSTSAQTKRLRTRRRNGTERQRTMKMNNGFAKLRKCIPCVAPDTNLSKIKVLILAISYITYLENLLLMDTVSTTDCDNSDNNSKWVKLPDFNSLVSSLNRNPVSQPCLFVRDLPPLVTSHRRAVSHLVIPKRKTRWPHFIWANKLDNNENNSEQDNFHLQLEPKSISALESLAKSVESNNIYNENEQLSVSTITLEENETKRKNDKIYSVSESHCVITNLIESVNALEKNENVCGNCENVYKNCESEVDISNKVKRYMQDQNDNKYEFGKLGIKNTNILKSFEMVDRSSNTLKNHKSVSMSPKMSDSFEITEENSHTREDHELEYAKISMLTTHDSHNQNNNICEDYESDDKSVKLWDGNRLVSESFNILSNLEI